MEAIAGRPVACRAQRHNHGPRFNAHLCCNEPPKQIHWGRGRVSDTAADSTSVAITATSAGGAPNVWGDFQPGFGGLGLDTGNGDDQIEGTGILRLHFASAVTLTGVATLFDPAHEDFGTGNPLAGSFLFCAGNSACTPTTHVTFSEANSANGTLGTPSTGTDFAFAELNGIGGNVEFYVSGLTYNPVPGPIVGAGLPGLIAACGGLLVLARKFVR
jgi:hypothetical protein